MCALGNLVEEFLRVVGERHFAGVDLEINSGVATNFAAGTVSAPGFYVTGDSNTRFYQDSADTLSITAGGVEVSESLKQDCEECGG